MVAGTLQWEVKDAGGPLSSYFRTTIAPLLSPTTLWPNNDVFKRFVDTMKISYETLPICTFTHKGVFHIATANSAEQVNVDEILSRLDWQRAAQLCAECRLH